jgi:hypothetical protein
MTADNAKLRKFIRPGSLRARLSYRCSAAHRKPPPGLSIAPKPHELQ